MARPKVVLDTNIFVRVLINPKGVNARLVRSLDRYLLITSPAILEEVVEVLSRPDLLRSKALAAMDVARVIEVLRSAPLVTPTVRVTACRDPDDNKFLEAAVTAKAQYVVTGDKDLRDIGEYEGIKIRYPAEFLGELGQQQVGSGSISSP